MHSTGFMRRLLPFAVVLAACGLPLDTQFPPNEALVVSGAAIDVRRCGSGLAAPGFAVLPKTSRGALSLGICGDFTSDDTTTVAGDLRVSGHSRVASPVNVAGSFLTGGHVSCPNIMNVGGDLVTAGDWTLSSPNDVRGNATVVGHLRHDNDLWVAGLLRAGGESGTGLLHTGSMMVAASAVGGALDCTRAPDVHRLAVSAWDKMSGGGIDPGTLNNVRTPTELTLGCGSYSLSGLSSHAALTVRIVGPTVLVVMGNVKISAPTTFVIEGEGSLELLIDGALEVDDTLIVGDREHAAVVAVAGDVRLAAATELHGVLLAPRSRLTTDDRLDVFGAIFAGSVQVGAPLVVHPGPLVGLEGWPRLAD